MREFLPLLVTLISMAFSGVATATLNIINTEQSPILLSGFNPNLTAQGYARVCNAVIESAKLQFNTLENDTSTATLNSVFGQFDNITLTLQTMQHSWYLKAVHPHKSIRNVATNCSIKYSKLVSDFSRSTKYFARVAAIDTSSLDKVEKYMVKSTLENFRHMGADKDEKTRNKIKALRKEIEQIGNQFLKNIKQDTRYVNTTIEGLRGLPQDYIDSKKASGDVQGNIILSTDTADLMPVMKYAENDQLRHALYLASRSRGYPKNAGILKYLIEKRHELAQLLNYKNWAEMSMKTKMIASPENGHTFLANVAAALREPVKKEKSEQLARLQQIDPSAQQVNVWQADYINNLMLQEDYALDSKEVREYFSYPKVRDGIFKLTEDLFGVQIRPWETEVWHGEVETFEIIENGKILGRFYMDNHPRLNKYKHSAHWTIRTGLKDRQIPISALAHNVPNGLMEHGELEIFLHSFGHLLHNMFSGSHAWFAIAGMSMERDFVEVPGHMLAKWSWDYDTLKSFAINRQGEVIPKSLFDKMLKKRNFGQAITMATQIYYAKLSLNYYSRDPNQFELMAVLKEISAAYNPYPFVEGTAFFANFSDLNGASSDYYIDQWSLAVASDIFSRFKAQGMRNTLVSKAYRDKVFGGGASRSASDLVKDFLGQEFTPDAYIESLKH